MTDDLAQAKFSIWKYTPPGPVAQRFIESKGPIDLIRGPWGSGKTVASVFKIARHCAADFPVCRDDTFPDGVIRVRAAAIRDTYREMAKTALQSWHEFFPPRGPFTRQPTRENYTGGSDRPVKHNLAWQVIRPVYAGKGEWVKRPIWVDLQMEFGAIGEQNLESFFKGYEISIGWMNECDLLHEDVPGKFYGRTGRYPPQNEVQPWEAERLGIYTDPDTGEQSVRVPRVILGDYNPPDEANWTYKREIEEPENWPGYNFFAQPSGLSARAENRAGKSRLKYEEEERSFGGPESADAKRNVHGEYAAKSAGAAIFGKTFSLNRHRADAPLSPVEGLPIYLGLDAGGTPACGIGQFMPSGQFRALDEIVTSPDSFTGATRFGEMILAVLMARYPGYPIGGAWGDPAAWYGADKERGELAFMDTVSQIIGYPIRPTHTNEVGARIEAVELQLRDIDAYTPGMLICPRLKTTLRAFASQYQKTKNATAGRTAQLEIVKNEYSHIAEGWQYLHLGRRGGGLIRAAASAVRGNNVVPMGRAKAPVPGKSIWDV